MVPAWSCFNSRTREGCDAVVVDYYLSHGQFQFTHPRGVRQLPDELHPAVGAVSIHAPARGATGSRQGERAMAGVSIHAPARGATIVVVIQLVQLSVSIHAPARGATEDEEGGGRGDEVSIHAPARGATRRLR